MQALSMNCRSMLQAMMGRWVSGTHSGALLGHPSVLSKSITSCRDDSHLLGSPSRMMAVMESITLENQ